ncbi:methylmalonyl Co-A mutase-associated GTPase MeaB [Gilvibacter sediminis]|uniref:methylmalonyl Co-A mutase-associated GTPase MeaB n=1 Tax=Gilvibacter sediminis TaxID=379071 RepID=UPI002350CBF5|nr:methylmalonyl Co-A mutase-associated GTPase MeaB [Gilvibacter sediminis]MDC7999297.1 methylmalonyl Co-A mutase-associated GTPase MeaB [Gilvibacter sediminis]
MSAKKKLDSALSETPGIERPESLSQASARSIKKHRLKKQSYDQLLNGILQGQTAALSKGITLIESKAKKHQEQAQKLIMACLPHTVNSIRIGITGVPGVGKSTFIEQFGQLLLAQGHKVAVLAVDPSSSISHGSILGDKTRMESLVKADKAFIRPSASGDSLGGVARKTREAIVLCEAAGYDIILIETVGVGQSETAVHSMTDFFLLLKLAGAGDELQGIKRGIIEMADAIVINKADGENEKAARLAKAEFNRALHLYPEKENGWTPKTLTCSAIENKGIDAIYQLIQKFTEQTQESGSFAQKRHQQEHYWFKETISNAVLDDFYNKPEIINEIKVQKALLDEQKTTPFEAAFAVLKMVR